MYCPFCNNSNDTKVIDSRLVGEGYQIRRRRECTACHERFTTYEVAELLMPHVIKSNQTREPFDEDKLRHSIEIALQKRPVNSEQIDRILIHIKSKLRATGEREVSSKQLGHLVIDELKEVDKVAYIRFASVYFSFDDISQFTHEIQKLMKKK